MPPGANFALALAQGLRARLADQPPETTARVTLYLNSGGMLKRVRAAFHDLGPGVLPRLRLVGAPGEGGLAGLPAAAPRLRRRLELARMVQELVAHQPDFAPGSAAFDLADSLADLIEEMQGEGIAPKALEAPGLAEDHAAHWERSLAFLRIVGRWFGDGAEADAALRQRLAVEALAAGWAKHPPADPLIVAGSTGSRGTTALLIQAVAQLPQGAVVLPGFDFDLPDFGWNSLDSGPVPDEDHPQYRFRRLMVSLGLTARDVRPWQGAAAPDPARNRLVSLALRPAPVTDQWLAEGAGLGDLGPACCGLSLIEAKSPRDEALAIAAILRKAADDGRSAALVTPDRILARRVTAALDRWDLRPDDSAGRPLHLTAPGRFLRHVAGLCARPATIEALLTLLKHPLAATGGGDRGQHLLNTRDLELHLRRHGPPFPDGSALRSWAGERADRKGWADWLEGCLAPMADAPDHPLASLTEMFLRRAGEFAAGPAGTVEASELWQRPAGRKALAVMTALEADAGHGGRYTGVAFADLVAALLQRETLPETDASHPAIAIHGIREAREVQADLVILGGLNDGIWPAAPKPDPWLSRQMRMNVGLLSPERQIGLAAHDFQQAIAAPEVILTRAMRDDEAETVPSRWLGRLTNLLRGLDGEDGALAAMRARGQVWCALAARLEEALALPPAPRPAPRPPVEARPKELPVTAINRLIRDPYAVYARYILRLKPLDPLSPQPDARLRGQVLHKIVERFVKERPGGEDHTAAVARLMATSAEVLADEIPWHSAQRLWLGRIGRLADRFARREAARAKGASPVLLEGPGGIGVAGLDFRLTARPDRIDQDGDGRLHIYDYKSGQPPTKKQQAAFDKQLLLEGAMAERGSFPGLGPQEVAAITYIHLGGDGKEVTTTGAEADFGAVWDSFVRLMARYMSREQGYIARRAVFEAAREGDYDQLARFGEWQMSSPSSPEDVG